MLCGMSISREDTTRYQNISKIPLNCPNLDGSFRFTDNLYSASSFTMIVDSSNDSVQNWGKILL